LIDDAATSRHAGHGVRPLTAKTPPKLAAGDQVMHKRYGPGKVLAVHGEGSKRKAHIQFGDQTMWILLRHSPIEKL
jgi:DNA helicase-2/ATP-dependent DNA helicase PcrA